MEQTTTIREHWFAELSEAIEGAQRLAWQLGTSHRTSEQARELYGRLEAAKLELNSLREPRTPNASLHIDPEWVQKFGLVVGPVDRRD